MPTDAPAMKLEATRRHGEVAVQRGSTASASTNARRSLISARNVTCGLEHAEAHAGGDQQAPDDRVLRVELRRKRRLSSAA
jgi:hypothetical protein